MSFESLFADVARGIEGVGVVIMTVGLVVVLARYCYSTVTGRRPGGLSSYQQLRGSMGRVILIGLEILIVGDIVGTIIVKTSIESVLALGLIVVIRTVLSFALEVEISGRWPWQQQRALGSTRPRLEET